MINDKQAQALSAARGANRQDKKTPLLINRDNLRLMPNTPLIAKRPQYMPYDGKATDDEETRRSYVEGGFTRRRQVVMEEEPFEIAKASKDELVAFALDQYGLALDASKGIAALRKDLTDCVKTFSQPVASD